MHRMKRFSNLIIVYKMSKAFCNVSNKALPPVVAICGATGTGKSKLAIDISRVFTGEVINADAIQLHCGLEIATNKVMSDETKGIRHNLLGCLSASEAAAFNIHKYRELCLPLIDRLRAKGSLPILAGGTCYYLEATLWHDFLCSTSLTGKIMSHSENEGFVCAICHIPTIGVAQHETALPITVAQISTHLPRDHTNLLSSISDSLGARTPLPSSPSDCYSLLHSLEPDTASRLHPRDTRKVRKALNQALHRQRPCGDGDWSGPTVEKVNRPCQPRYPDASLLLWLDCEPAVLDIQLDRRVDKMLESGLIRELEGFVGRHIEERHNAGRLEHQLDKGEEDRRSPTLDRLFTSHPYSIEDSISQRGILQAIGFKEFANFLAIPPVDRETKEAQKIFKECIQAVKSATRRYARRQRKWITNRFLCRPHQGSIPVYRLDVTELLAQSSPSSSQSQEEAWTRHVLAPASRLVHNLVIMATQDSCNEPKTLLQSLLNLCPVEACPRPVETSDASPRNSHYESEHVCQVCNRTLYGDADWAAHTKSRRHQRKVAAAAARVKSNRDQNSCCA